MRAPIVTDADIALLRALGRESSVVAASREVGISRDRAVYRLARLEKAFGAPVVASVRGGRTFGASRLTPLGDRVARRGFNSVELIDARPMTPPSPSNVVQGVYRSHPTPHISLGGRLDMRVVFDATDGERVAAALDPESIILARRRFPSSARNVLRASVLAVQKSHREREAAVVVRAGRTKLRVTVTNESVRQLRLERGALVWLYVKATALRRLDAGSGIRRAATAHRRPR